MSDEDERASSSILNRVFSSCSDDPKGSVHRAWGLSLIFVLVYFVLAVIEMLNVRSAEGSNAVMVAACWTGLSHLLLAVTGTFVLKRFPTSFAVGFFLGLLVVFANQNLILFAVFHSYAFGTPKTNVAFSGLCFFLAFALAFFALLLGHFRNELVMAAVDVKGFPKRGGSRGDKADEEGYRYERT
mmetsp:Transcript_18616/g.27664  ORF Transcript_18616/g.27664 Transcript_18616/m.27664 type:complete len:185 (-) Transcript_18616:208-762(-)|eukprot:CAMPEP_0194037682 /NCGR_PEP_ID=MMETSP0009_2-20130614/10014_1 /TAXON_ID=210454 /ORGANISM="Grammatophora oceanica, Strain CCMP 410" /LENGTH=184 /DNA_ID=CAMNT_0038679937 /DNA_START=84 /DNA_END=638 /DNA_ORIENTATION=+